MEVDGVAEPLPVSEAAGAMLEPLDPTVHAFGVAVVQVEYDGIEDAPQLATDGLCGRLHRPQPTALGPSQPAPPGLLSPTPTLVAHSCIAMSLMAQARAVLSLLRLTLPREEPIAPTL